MSESGDVTFSKRGLRAVGSGIVHFNKEIGAFDRSGSRVLWTDAVNPAHRLKWEKGKAERERSIIQTCCCCRAAGGDYSRKSAQVDAASTSRRISAQYAGRHR